MTTSDKLSFKEKVSRDFCSWLFHRKLQHYPRVAGFFLLLPILNFKLRVGMQTLGSSVRRRQNEVKGAEDEEMLS